VAERIRDLKPDIVLVGMSLPKKELFLLRWKEFMQVPVAVACGGYLDVLAGKTTLAPTVIERMGMSWLWRVIQEPRRLFSNIFVSVLLFLFYILPVAMICRVFAPGKSLHVNRLFRVR
jgi:N-acetylglucosaminyldiphosphoundecaprenol N-acetyl-beta-D-mannosaminyltransferase